jgi:hypothetical protein
MNPQPADIRKKKLVARTVAVTALDAQMLADAFALFEEAYEGTDRERFERDLAEKQWIILLRDRESGALKGFSTVLVEDLPGERPATVVFSGDTVIHRDYWGQKQLQIAFVRILLSLKLRSPRRRLCWFLLSKGYRTYLLLANAFPKAVPRYDRADDPYLRAALNELASRRFGPAYDRARGIVRFDSGHERVRSGLAPITIRHLENLHVRFFVARNPGHSLGEELACLAEVRLIDITRIAVRLVATLARRALGVRREVEGSRAGRRWDVRHAEGS